ncbi:MAG: creatininase family protein [Chloroflexi bacterium]|nr:creatininase family protein [Chloroflexota bacterium]
MKYLLGEMTWPQVKELARPGTVVMVPVGAIEQHGPHLPIDTDARCAEAVAHRSAEATGDVPVLVAPLQSYAISGHHMEFPGTMALSSQTFLSAIIELTMCLVHHGFKNIFWLNGHGGNFPCLSVAARDVRNQVKVCMAVASFWQIAGDQIKAIRESGVGGIAHACELETSLIMHLRPDLVRTEHIKKNIPKWRTPWFGMDLIYGRKVMLGHQVADFTRNGVFGDPTLSTPEKGKRFMDAITQAVADFLKDFSTWDLDTLYTYDE